jgi:DNA-binding MarR family transcriptional regulator
MKKEKSVEHELMVVEVLRAADRVNLKMSQILKGHALTMVQYNILRILRGAQPEMLGVGEIKERVFFSNADVSRLLDRLVVKELVIREICPGNRRKMNVSISKNGLKVLKGVEKDSIKELDNFYSSSFSVKEAEKLAVQLKKMN